MKSFCDSVFRLEFATPSSGSQGQTSPVSWHRGLAPGGEHTTSQHIGDSAEILSVRLLQDQNVAMPLWHGKTK